MGGVKWSGGHGGARDEGGRGEGQPGCGCGCAHHVRGGGRTAHTCAGNG